MKPIIMILLSLTFMCSCNKDQITQPQRAPQSEQETSLVESGTTRAELSSPLLQQADSINDSDRETDSLLSKKDDDDAPIVMISTHNIYNGPLGGVLVTFTKGDHIISVRTNIFGERIVKLPSRGVWQVNCTKIFYQPLNVTLDVRYRFCFGIFKLHK